jgi:AcrR family transcriptional regulator
VYRYFPDPSGLLTAALLRDFGQANSALDCASVVKGDLHARIDAFVDTRLRLYQAFAPSCRVAQLHASGNVELAGVLRYARDLVGDHIRIFFGPELKRMPPATADAVLLALGAIFQLESLDEYTLGRGLSLEAVRCQTTEACTRILGRRPRATVAAPTLDLTEASVGGHAEDSALDRHS